MSKFLVHSEYGELLDLAIQLQDEGHEVLLHITGDEYKHIGDGIIEKCTNLLDYLGKGYIWLVDGCEHGRMQDLLREKGEAVFGGSEQGDKLENERQLAQKWFKKAGFYQPLSKTFRGESAFDEAITWVKEHT